MQGNRLLNDLSGVIHGAIGGAMDVKREIEAAATAKLEKLLHKADLVTKEEFDNVSAMLSKSRIEQEALKSRIDTLEQRIIALTCGENSNK